ncbi:IgaA/UmoB family intracellular growth attenuator, partial [Klebsiella pneumoniae]|uniref:IgaA/UmoB family intracellular growth attenuator n=1 Tax=Klebsiella pneumoniae TaxID=573 RepID=UPI00210D77F0
WNRSGTLFEGITRPTSPPASASWRPTSSSEGADFRCAAAERGRAGAPWRRYGITTDAPNKWRYFLDSVEVHLPPFWEQHINDENSVELIPIY